VGYDGISNATECMQCQEFDGGACRPYVVAAIVFEKVPAPPTDIDYTPPGAMPATAGAGFGEWKYKVRLNVSREQSTRIGTLDPPSMDLERGMANQYAGEKKALRVLTVFLIAAVHT
jgi:hypothetical protein